MSSNFLLDVTINKFILKEVECMQEMFIHAEEVRELLGIWTFYYACGI